MPSVTAIVCTHDGAARLPRTLDAVMRAIETCGTASFEVVVVDNVSRDGTAAVVQERFAAHPSVRARLVRETKPGLAYARRAGIAAAAGEIVAFIDDDNWPSPAYFDALRRVFAQEPGIGVFGCSTRLPADREFPPAIAPFARSYAVGDLHKRSGPVPAGSWVWGAGLALRRAAASALFEAGFDPVLAGRSGALQLAGDDSEIVLMAALCGWGVWYECRPLIEHAIDPARFTADRLIHMHEGFGASAAVIARYSRRARGQRGITGAAYPALRLLYAPVILGRAWLRMRREARAPSLQGSLLAAESRGQVAFLREGAALLRRQAANLAVADRLREGRAALAHRC